MTKRLLDFNPVTGERVWFQYDHHDDHMTITHEQEVDQLLDLCAEERANPEYTRNGFKRDWWHYAHVPNTVIVEMKQKHNVDFFAKEDSGKVFKLLNTEYKRFKTTDKTHNVRNR